MYTAKKKLFLLRFFVLFPAKIYKKNFLEFSRQVKIIVLFSEKKLQLSFCLEQAK